MDKRVFHKEALSLVQAGHEVSHLAPGDGREWIQDGVRIVTYPAPRGLWSRLSQLRSLYRRARSLDAAVYHCNEVDSWIVGAALRLFARRAFIFDVHEHYPEDFADFHCPLWLRPAARSALAVFINILSRFTSGVVLAKSSLEDSFSHLPRHRVAVVENFVSLSVLKVLEQPKSLRPPLRLIHLGLLSRARGWPQLLEGLALTQRRDFELLVLGEFNDGTEAEFQSEVARLGLNGQVRSEAWLPYDQAMAQVDSSDVGLIVFQPGYFNHVHALPHKMFDYMASELAIIGPEFAVDVARIVRESECGLLVDPSRPGSIADAVVRLCEDKELAQTLGRRGRQAVTQRYNWEAESAKLLALYRRLEQQMERTRCAAS